MQDWMKDWEALQRQFLGAMSDLVRPKPVDPMAGWQAFTQPFATAFAPAPAAPAEVLDRLNASAKGYFAWLQSLAANAGDMGSAGGAAAWTEAMRKSFNVPGIDPSLLDNPLAQTLRDLGGQGAKGFDAMMAEFAKAAAPFKQEFLSETHLPAFGLAREHQERWQALARAMAEYQEQSNRYQALIFGASREAFERFQGKLAEREEPGRQIESARQLYDLWIDAAEEAYADAALSPQFREVYGNMVNAQMRVRALVQGEVERMAAQLGMPTRSEVRSLEKAVHELRRAMKKPAAPASAPAARDESSAAQFKAEIEALRAELAAAKKAARGAESHTPRAAAPAKKKSAKAAGPAPSVSAPAPARPNSKARKR
jgi:class III poly(R)-hydroxyalkanoic acid synthase PhaE subunit